jgi:hypothetical protein
MDQEKEIPKKKSYSTPILCVHGGIKELTQSGMAQPLGKVDVRSKAADRTV